VLPDAVGLPGGVGPLYTPHALCLCRLILVPSWRTLWHCVLVFSGLCHSCRSACGSTARDDVKQDQEGPTLRVVLAHLQGNNHASVRQYQEAIVTAMVLRRPALIGSHLHPVLCQYQHRCARRCWKQAYAIAVAPTQTPLHFKRVKMGAMCF
jgi:hypothetical protein